MSVLARAAHALSELRRVARTGAWVLRRAWETNPTATLAVFAVIMILGLVPLALAVAMRGLINAAMALNGHEDPLALLLPWRALAFVVALVEAITPLASKMFL